MPIGVDASADSSIVGIGTRPRAARRRARANNACSTQPAAPAISATTAYGALSPNATVSMAAVATSPAGHATDLALLDQRQLGPATRRCARVLRVDPFARGKAGVGTELHHHRSAGAVHTRWPRLRRRGVLPGAALAD